jgi:hypothetical protein
LYLFTQHASKQVTKPSDITAADKLIFPGVGAFGQAMDVLQQRDFVNPLVDYIQVRAAVAAAATAAVVPYVSSITSLALYAGDEHQWLAAELSCRPLPVPAAQRVLESRVCNQCTGFHCDSLLASRCLH